MINDTYEAMQDQGVKALFTVGIPSSFGVGVQTQLPNTGTKSTNKKTTRKPSGRKSTKKTH